MLEVSVIDLVTARHATTRMIQRSKVQGVCFNRAHRCILSVNCHPSEIEQNVEDIKCDEVPLMPVDTVSQSKSIMLYCSVGLDSWPKDFPVKYARDCLCRRLLIVYHRVRGRGQPTSSEMSVDSQKRSTITTFGGAFRVLREQRVASQSTEFPQLYV